MKSGEYMARKYNLGSKSDMRQLERDLKNSVMEQAKSSIMHSTHKITCPKCGLTFNARIGLNTCPRCHKSIDLTLDM